MSLAYAYRSVSYSYMHNVELYGPVDDVYINVYIKSRYVHDDKTEMMFVLADLGAITECDVDVLCLKYRDIFLGDSFSSIVVTR